MAQYHFHANIIQRSKGHSAVASAAYRAGERIHDQRIGDIFDYGRRRGIEYTDIMAPENAPAWMLDRAQLWNGVEKAEKRIDSQLARSVDISLMCELTLDQNIELLRSFVNEQWVSKGMVADIAVHEPGRHSDARNVHAHILLTMREIDDDEFGKKRRDWNDKNSFMEWREAWAKHANHALEREGFEERIDHRSLVDQGIDREPEIHVGPAAKGMEQKNQPSERAEQNRELKHINDELERLQADLAKAEQRIVELRRLKHVGATTGPPFDGEPLQPPSGVAYPSGQGRMPDDITRDQAIKDEAERQRLAADQEKARQDQAAKDEQDRLKKLADDEKARKDADARQEAERQQKLAEYNKRVEELARANAERLAAQAEEMRQEYARQQELNRKAELDKYNLEQAQQANLTKQKLKEANARAIEDQQAQGHIREAGMRYGAALAANYDMNDPYGSLAKSAMAEYAAFLKERESYTKQIAEENDPTKRQSLELRKRIEGAEYLAITGERIAKQSELITGRLNSQEAQKEREKVAFWKEQSKEARQQLLELERQQTKQKAQEPTRAYRPRRSKGARELDDIIKQQDEAQKAKQKEAQDKEQERLRQQQLERKRKQDRDRER